MQLPAAACSWAQPAAAVAVWPSCPSLLLPGQAHLFSVTSAISCQLNNNNKATSSTTHNHRAQSKPSWIAFHCHRAPPPIKSESPHSASRFACAIFQSCCLPQQTIPFRNLALGLCPSASHQDSRQSQSVQRPQAYLAVVTGRSVPFATAAYPGRIAALTAASPSQRGLIIFSQ